MSDHRRSSSRQCVTKQRPVPSNSLSSVPKQTQNEIKTKKQPNSTVNFETIKFPKTNLSIDF
jgi:hypothetical protein